MKQLHIAILIIFIGILNACSSEKKEIKEGELVYELDYPDFKDNFFIYGVLPKEMRFCFKGDESVSAINKVMLSNELYVNNKTKEINVYFKNADDVCYSYLSNSESGKMDINYPKFEFDFTNKKDTMCGFNVEQVIVSKPGSSAKIEIWYTKDIAISNPNWHTPFHEVPGVMLSYTMTRYGMKTTVKAKQFIAREIKPSELKPRKEGKKMNFDDYNVKMFQLFKSFE
jgi:hypothetical protein